MISSIDNAAPNDSWESRFKSFYEERKPNTDAIQQLTKRRMTMFADDMSDLQYREYRYTLDLLNNAFPEDFWSVERLIRFSTVPYSKILPYQNVETEIVRKVKQCQGNSKFTAGKQSEEVESIIKSYKQWNPIISIT